MRKFKCETCSGQIFFENSRCLYCQSELGFVRDGLTLATFKGAERNKVAQQRIGGTGFYKRCENLRRSACNWMIEANSPTAFCVACRLNQTIPDLSKPANHQGWRKLEIAKRRLIYSLLSLGLPVHSKDENTNTGLAFEFLETSPQGVQGAAPVLTGHSGGLITINLDEADDVTREKARQRMGEMYRTLLGHFRHEIGHHYWDQFVGKGSVLTLKFREVFGDERVDYGSALRRYYANGAAADWQQRHVSAYATAHPWEDWAETWAHYLHIVDTLETAWAEGLAIQSNGNSLAIRQPLGLAFSEIAKEWQAVRLLLNELNRSMGLPDPYPFVLSGVVISKLTLIHDWIRSGWRG